MQLPKWVFDMLSTKFSEEQMKLIDTNWYTFSEISFSNSTSRELFSEARMVLKLSK